MANTGFFHHIGTFLLFAATILLLITTISAPVVNNIALLKVHLGGGSSSSVSFGSLGYCITQPGDDLCSKKHIGYDPAGVIRGIDNSHFNLASSDTTKALTRVMILHPIACGVSFIAFLFALGSGFCGAIFAAFVALIAFIISLVAVACDFVLFGIIKRHVNDEHSGNNAKFSVAIWTLLVATICLFLGTIVVLITCCSSRLHSQRNRNSKHVEGGGYANGPTSARRGRHFWQRRGTY